MPLPEREVVVSIAFVRLIVPKVAIFSEGERQRMKNLYPLVVFLIVMTAVACATPTPEATRPAPAGPVASVTPVLSGKTTRIMDAVFSDAVSLQPLITNDTASSAYQSLVYAPLVRTDPQTLEVRGNLYEDNPTLSADGAKLTWKLRPGLKWSDGMPLTARDVEFTWNKLMEEKTKFPAKSFFANSFKVVQAVDDLTVEYTLTRPGFCPAIRNSNLPGPVPMHVFKDVDINANEFNDKPSVTSGLWQFQNWRRDDIAEFAPTNPNYVRGEPALGGYTYRIVKNSTVALQLFKTQEIDIIRPDPADWEEIKKLPFAQTFEYYPALASWTFIGFNMNHPVLSDRRVRQAISYAVNKQEMVDKIRLGYAQVQYSNIPTTSWAATDQVLKFNYDVTKAKALLKEAGWTPGADGILTKDGKKFQVRLFYNAGNKQREMISIITQDYLKAMGIGVEVIAEEWTALLKRLQEPDPKKRDFEMFVLGWSGSMDPSDLASVWQSKGSQNYVGFSDAEVDKLYDDAAITPGCRQEDRKKAYVRIQQIIAEEQPYLFLYTNQSLVAVNKRIQVNPVSVLGIAYQLEQWQLTK